MFKKVTLFVWVSHLIVSVSYAEQLRCPVTADVWVSSYAKERNSSMGKTSQIKLKGYGEFGLFRFDVSNLQSKTINSARLFLHGARPWIDLSKGTVEEIKAQRFKVNSLKRIGLSTVSQNWAEGVNNRRYDVDPKGASFNCPARTRWWAWPGSSNLSDVILTNGHSRASHVELKREKGGDGRWFSVPVASELIRAMVSGESDGLAVFDAIGQTMENNFIHSREMDRYAPYLVVEVGKKVNQQPGQVKAQVTPAPERAGLKRASADLQLTVPKNAFSYFIKVNGMALPRWQTPVPLKAGQRQRIRLDNLKASSDIEVEIIIDNGYGLKSKPVIVRGRSSPYLAQPTALPSVKQVNVAAEPKEYGGKLKVWAIPDGLKVNPVSSKVYHTERQDYRLANTAWSGKENRITLFGCRGEFVSFQLVLEGEARKILLKPSDLKGSKGSIDAKHFEVFRQWYVHSELIKNRKHKEATPPGWHPDFAMPMIDVPEIAVPAIDQNIPNQQNQSIWFDLYIPKEAAAGDYKGQIRISAEGIRQFSVDVQLKVYSFTMPDNLVFVPTLNTYRNPQKLFEEYRLAHKHRTNFHRAAHGSHLIDYRKWFTPKIAGSGKNSRVVDWKAYDERFGPILDGSLFKDLPRSGVPVDYFRLPFCEDWPSSHEEGFPWREPFPRNLMKPKETTPSWMVETYMAMKGPEPTPEAYTPEYRDRFKAIMAEFVRHAKEKGWTQTDLQVMLSSKIYYRNQWPTQAMWRFDEPMHRDDYRATALFCRFVKEGVALAGKAAEGVRVTNRQDISRPIWQFDSLDGLIDDILIGGIWHPHSMHRGMIQKEQVPCKINAYKMLGPSGASNLQQMALCVAFNLRGIRHALQWNGYRSVHSNKLPREGKYLDTPNNYGFIVDTRKTPLKSPVIASTRLKTLRRGQQDAELVDAVRKKRGYTHEQMRVLVGEYSGGKIENKKATYAEESVGANFSNLNLETMVRIREQLLLALE